MNFLEQWAIQQVLLVLQFVIKNPAHAAELKSQLLGVANDIYATYGMTPPSLPPSGTASA